MSQYLVSECIAKEEKSKFKGHYSAENSSISSKFIINIEQLTRTNEGVIKDYKANRLS